MKQVIVLGISLLFVIHPVRAQPRISGYIISLETAKPITNATIFLKNRYNLPLEDTLQATSDSSGFYRIDGITEGTYILNAWTSYRIVDQRYAQVIQSNKIEVDSSLTVDLVFSEHAFKYRLHSKNHPWETFANPKRSSDRVARRAVRPQLFINSQRDTVFASFIENITNTR